MIAVLRANESDIDWIMGELKEFDNFFDSKKSLYGDGVYQRDAMLGMIEKQVVFVAWKNGDRVGFIAGFLAPHIYNPDITVLSEVFWWVPVKHRGSRAGLLLLRKFTEYGKQNADWVCLGIEDKSPINERTLTKRGYKLFERNYVLET